MPTYDYHCAKCTKTYEIREGFDAPSRHRCQECGKGTAKRVLTAPRILFKGSGWYVTDSKSKSAVATEGDNGAPSSESAPSGGDAPATGDAKPTTPTASESKPKTEKKAATKSESSTAS